MQVSLVGVGMGNVDTLTIGGYNAIVRAQLIIGASRILDSIEASVKGEKIVAISPKDISKIIEENSSLENICVVFSGDIGFYSGAKKLLPLLSCYEVKTFCGITTVQYMSSKIGRDWQDVKLVSAHGIDCDILGEVLSSEEVFFLTGGKITPSNIIGGLCSYGLSDTLVYVGERLSYEDEKITFDKAENLKGKTFHSLSAVWVVRNTPIFSKSKTVGIEDTQFIRGNVPMTKQEIRAIIASKLCPKDGNIIYDVGAGTGSVSVELALLSPRIKVFAMEVNAEACELIKQNIFKFGCQNVKLIQGIAPDTMGTLPIPNSVFIGGSKGNMFDILKVVKDKNPNVRVVITAIAIETLAQAITSLKELQFNNMEVTQVAISKTKSVGNYNMLMGQNPIFIISAGGI